MPATRSSLAVLIAAAALALPVAAFAQEGPRPGGKCADRVALANSELRQSELETQRRALEAQQRALGGVEQSLRNIGQTAAADAQRAFQRGVGQGISAVSARIEVEKAIQADYRRSLGMPCPPTSMAPPRTTAPFMVGQSNGFAAQPVNVTAAPGPASALAIAMRPAGSPPPANLGNYGR